MEKRKLSEFEKIPIYTKHVEVSLRFGWARNIHGDRIQQHQLFEQYLWLKNGSEFSVSWVLTGNSKEYRSVMDQWKNSHRELSLNDIKEELFGPSSILPAVYAKIDERVGQGFMYTDVVGRTRQEIFIRPEMIAGHFIDVKGFLEACDSFGPCPTCSLWL